jgi:flagellar biosynthetic protein FliR
MLVIDPHWVMGTALLSLRLSAVWMLTPLMTLFKAPMFFRVLFTVSLSAALCAALPAAAWPQIDSPVALALSVGSELLLGAVLALGLHAAFGAMHFAGRLVDLQIGFGAGGIFDPSTRSQASALSIGLQWLAVVVFFTIDAHHALLRGISHSLVQVPIGSLFTHLALPQLLSAFGLVFVLALMVCAPVLMALLVLETGLAVLSRSLPQMNVFFVSIPLKILVGLGMLALTSRQLAPVIARGYAMVFEYWQQVLG